MKKKILFIIIMLLTSLTLVKALKVEDVKVKNYANDYSDVLSSELEEYINSKGKQLEDASGAQIVVVTIPSLEGRDLESFATDLFNHVGIGDKDKDNGLLILLVTGDRKLRVATGSGIEGFLNDGKVGRYEDQYMISYLRNNDWEQAIKNGYDAFFNEIVKEYNLDLETATLPKVHAQEGDKLSSRIIFAICIIFFGPLVIGVIRSRYSFGITDIVILILAFVPAFILRVIGKPEIAGIAAVLGVIWDIVFLAARFGDKLDYGGRGGGWSSGGYSGGGFSGGGGSSSGGGASRSF